MFKKYFDLRDETMIRGNFWDSDEEDLPTKNMNETTAGNIDMNKLFFMQVGKEKFYK